MTDLTNVQFNHKFLATLSLTIHIQNISTIPLLYYLTTLDVFSLDTLQACQPNSRLSNLYFDSLKGNNKVFCYCV
jgi:hypothetical protein